MGIWYKRNPVSNCIPKSRSCGRFLAMVSDFVVFRGLHNWTFASDKQLCVL